MSDDGDYDGDEGYYDNDDGDYGDENDVELQPPQLDKQQTSALAYKNTTFFEKAVISTRVIQSIEYVQGQQGISRGRALFLLRACGYNEEESQNIPSKIMDDIYFSETEDSSKAKNNKKCLTCDKELDDHAFSLECNHRFCKDCTDKYITEQLESQVENNICCKCQFASCKERFGDKDFEKLLQQQHYKEYLSLLEKDAYLLANYIVKCPNKECSLVMIQNDQLPLKGTIKNIRCECKTPFCCGCGNNAHEPLKCNIVDILKTLEKAHGQLKLLKDKEEYYTKTSSQPSNKSTTQFCPNGCGKFLLIQDENLAKCPFCEGKFCRKCDQHESSCQCVKEESKEDQQEAEVQEREQREQNIVQIPLPKVVSYLFDLAELSLDCKQQIAYVKVAKKKLGLLSIMKKSQDHLSFVIQGLETLEDITLFLGHAKIFLAIGALQSVDLVRFQVDELQKLYLQLKPLLMEFHSRFSQLSENDINKEPFQSFKEQVNRLVNQIPKIQQNLDQDFKGVTVNEQVINDNYQVYVKEQQSAIDKIRKEQDKRSAAARTSFEGMDFGGGKMSGRMHGYGGGDYQRYYGNKQRNYNHDMDSDDDENDFMSFQRKQGNQMVDKKAIELLRKLNEVKRNFPSQVFQKCQKCTSIEEIDQIVNEHIIRNKPLYKSQDILVIPPQGIRINKRAYMINLEEENIQDSKILSQLFQNHQEIFKLHEEKNKKFSEITNWAGSFLNYFEFLFMQEYEKIQKKPPQTSKFCTFCKKFLYSENEPDFQAKIIEQLQEVKDSDVIYLESCQHASHLACFKQQIQADGSFNCSCKAKYIKSIQSTISISQQQINNQSSAFVIEYHLKKQTFEDFDVNEQSAKAYIYPCNTYTEQVCRGYMTANERGLTFEVKAGEDGKKSIFFRIEHDMQPPGRYQNDQSDLIFNVSRQLEEYNIKI